jgi:serine/threonine protein kinase
VSPTTCGHPGVVDVSDVFEANGTAYMALGYEEGLSFAKWLQGLGRFATQAEFDAILTPLLDALAYVHGKDMLHRDIAPDNIIIRNDGSPVLIDFGAARQAIAERSQVMSAIVKGGYSPPEQYTTTGKALVGHLRAWRDAPLCADGASRR